MTISSPESGYTLPVFATASAIAALDYLRHAQPLETVTVDLITPPETAEIAIAQVAKIRPGMALAITHSHPGDNLDLTRNTPIWAVVEWGQSDQFEQVQIVGGEGIGKQLNAGGQAAIYNYAQQLLQVNLTGLLAPTEKIKVTIILPEGRKLAERTSNAAFGIVEGLSLLGTTGISQPLSMPEQLEKYRQELQDKASKLLAKNWDYPYQKAGRDREALGEGERGSSGNSGRGTENNQCPMPHAPMLVFCIGENGLDLARKMGINSELLVKTANWLGPLLVEAGLQKVPAILLLGYHGKLLKLAGGIFHTHHHVADGRLEILTAYCAQVGLATPILQQVLASPTAEAALKYLRQLDQTEGGNWVEQVYRAIASGIEQRCQEYIRKHSEQSVRVSVALFDSDRQIIISTQTEQLL